VVVLQVPPDRVRTGIQARLDELLAQPQPQHQFHRRAAVARGEVFGRRLRGSNTASPSTAYLASSRLIQPCDTPYVRATSDCDRPASTAVITNRRFDTPETSRPHTYSDV
jgi:hypothetical protein